MLKSRENDYIRRYPSASIAWQNGFDIFSKDREGLLISLLDKPWLIWDGLLSEVKQLNPTLVEIAEEELRIHKEKKLHEKWANELNNLIDTPWEIKEYMWDEIEDKYPDIVSNAKLSLEKWISKSLFEILGEKQSNLDHEMVSEISKNTYDIEKAKSKLTELLANEFIANSRIEQDSIHDAQASLTETFSSEKKKKRSRRLTQDVKDKVWNRDGGKCVECGSNENLEFDHIIPFSKGGANTYRNIQLLCEKCNRSKSNKIG